MAVPEKLDVLNLLSEIPYMWYEIGTVLKVNHGDLESLKRSHESDILKLSHVIQLWMEQIPTPVTWDTIKNAVCHPTIKKESIHQKIVEFLQKKNGPSATTVVPQKTANKDAHDAGKLETVPDPPDVSEYCPPMRDIEDRSIDTLPDDINIILVTATEIEFRAAIGQAKPLEGKNYGLYDEKDVVFYVGYYGSYKVAIIKTDQGYKETSRKLEPVQNALRAQYVISIGICYGMKPGKVKLGDVIVGTKIKDLYNKRVSHGDVHVRSDEYEPGPTLSRMFGRSAGFKLSSGDTEYVDIKFGVLVSETTLVASQEYKDQILKQVSEALGGEMEAAGIMEAAKKANFEAIVMKAVADWGNEKKEPYRKWQEFAAVAAAKYVLYHLEKSPKSL